MLIHLNWRTGVRAPWHPGESPDNRPRIVRGFLDKLRQGNNMLKLKGMRLSPSEVSGRLADQELSTWAEMRVWCWEFDA